MAHRGLAQDARTASEKSGPGAVTRPRNPQASSEVPMHQQFPWRTPNAATLLRSAEMAAAAIHRIAPSRVREVRA